MATTTKKKNPTRQGKNGAKASKGSSARTKTSNGRAAQAQRSRANGSRSQSRNGSRASSNGAKAASSAKEATKSRGQDTVEGVSSLAQKAKAPLVAGGAALAGVAGAIALNATRNRKHKVLGISLPKHTGFKLPKSNGRKLDVKKASAAVTDAAKHADRFGQRVSNVASTVQQVSETTEKAAK
jgi:hypothetical protein